MELELCYDKKDLQTSFENEVNEKHSNEEGTDEHNHAHNSGANGGCTHDHGDGGPVQGVFTLIEKDEPDHMHCGECGKRVESGIACRECGRMNIWI